MKIKILFCFLFLFIFFASFPNQAKAAEECFTTDPVPPLYGPLPDNKLKFIFNKNIIESEIKNYRPTGNLYVSFPIYNNTGGSICSLGSQGSRPAVNRNNPEFEMDISYHRACGLLGNSKHKIELLWVTTPDNTPHILCSGYYTIESTNSTCDVKPILTSGIGDVNSNWEIEVTNIKSPDLNVLTNNGLTIVIGTTTYNYLNPLLNYLNGKPNTDSITMTFPDAQKTAGIHSINVYAAICAGGSPPTSCVRKYQMCALEPPLEIMPQGTPAQPTITPILPTPTIPDFCTLDPNCQKGCAGRCSVCPGCPDDPNKSPVKADLKPICDQLSSDFRGKCWECVNKSGSEGHTWTAIGCIPNDFSAVVRDYVLVVGISIAGGTSFLYFLYGAFLILTSAGNAEAVEEAKQIIISALSGLLLIIFSIFLLRIIGVDILKIPGFQ